ncbi:hypothetical protein ABEB36_009505 [Hypothenemus hampei]|uniref:DDE Tnp4 domain-containing protein n=1 Tax=Hypothenemus hampei TaxID=57062 RepID=A0ABD1EGX6_HYPHA
MTPFRNPNTLAEKAYNKRHTKERVIIERCFGQLKQRFPILQYKVRVSGNILPQLIMCCFVVHNVVKYVNDDWEGFGSVAIYPDPDGEQREENFEGVLVRNEGQQRRIEISNMILNLENRQRQF